MRAVHPSSSGISMMRWGSPRRPATAPASGVATCEEADRPTDVAGPSTILVKRFSHAQIGYVESQILFGAVSRVSPTLQGGGQVRGREDSVTSVTKRVDRPTPALSRKTLNRNWDELMQELRATQTGVQILTGFLLTVPFSSRFDALTATQRWLYMAVLAGAVTATCLILAPVAFHRLLFRQRRRLLLVEAANRFALAGLGALLLTVSGMVFLVADVVLGGDYAWAAAGMAMALFFALWVLAPFGLARSGRFPRNPPPG
jgi:hypothetical protein